MNFTGITLDRSLPSTRAPGVMVPVSLAADHGPPFRGVVEVMAPASQISGWALDMEHPAETLRVELLFGDRHLAEVATTVPRPDIAAHGIACAAPGFAFPPEAIARLREAQELSPDDVPRVQIAGTPFILRRKPQHGSIPAMSRPRAPGTAVQTHAVPEQPPAIVTLKQRLDQLLAGAAATPLPEASIDVPESAGRIEAMWQAHDGICWIKGWLNRGLPRQFPALLATDPPLGAGVLLATHEARGTPPNTVAVFGLIRTEAVLPTADLARHPLRFGPRGERALAFAEDIVIWSADEALRHYAGMMSGLAGCDARLLGLVLLDSAVPPAPAGEPPHPYPLRRIMMQLATLSEDIDRLYNTRAGLSVPPPPDFNEAAYLATYPDVASAVESGKVSNGFEHYVRWGRAEGRTRPSLLR